MRYSSQTNRGDLLRWVQCCQNPEVQRQTAPLLGYELPKSSDNAAGQPGKQEDSTDKSVTDGKLIPKDPPPSTSERPAPELFYAVKHWQQYASPEALAHGLSPNLQRVEPLPDKPVPFAQGAPIPWRPILPAPRLAHFLRQSVAQVTGQKLDVPKLVKQVARLKIIKHLPRQPRLLPAGRVVVLVDLNTRLRPFWQDAHALCALLVRLHGRNGLAIRVIDGHPHGGFSDWFDGQQQWQAWQPLPIHSAVLIISDLGQLAGADNPLCQHWLGFFYQLQRQSINPVVLAPISAAQQSPILHNISRQVLWNRHSRLQPQPIANSAGHQAAVKRVLGLLSCAVHVEPELLRAILACLPAAQADSGIEAAVYLHEAVQWGYTAITLRADQRADYQALFRQEDPALQEQVIALLKAHHIGQFPAVWAEEVLNIQPLVALDLAEDVQQAETFMCQLTHRFHANASDAGMGQYVRRHLGRLTAKGQRAYDSTLYGLAYKEQLRQGAAIPTGYDVASIYAVVAEPITAKNYVIRQIGEQLWVSAEQESQEGLQVGADFCRFTGYRDTLTVSQSTGETGELRLLPSASGVVIAMLQGQDITVDTGLEKWLISPVRKPSWADSIARKAEGLVAYRSFMGRRYEFPWSMKPNEFSWMMQEIKTSAAEGYWLPPDPNMPEYFTVRPANALEELAASLTVSLDHYGLYADLGVANTSQRFRWLEPGEFLMGSPDDELGRYSDETQHHVTLTQGFWLADTAVTQAFWQVLMGNNPSRFKDNPDNPVEQVSWQDAQAFINKLNGLFPPLQAHLPSEAQWEYACRAGTTTAFSFGANITAEQVNYDGTRPYTDGTKRIYIDKTVPVKSLPPNPWGLYEMHGNVWEWCADVWQEAMTAEPVIDPLSTGGDTDALRVVRGGSWDYSGKDVRSAIRSRRGSVIRNYGIGLRLALGLVEHRLGGKVVMQTKSTGKLL